MFKWLKKKPRTTGSGIGLPGGSEHYRAFVGPPHYYDLMAAMAFNLLTSIGLRQQHKFLDIGCGSLRMGRLLMPYLNKTNYIGVEPSEWLVQDGILNEIGKDMIRIKAPRFIFSDSLQEEQESLNINFALAQSIFTHCSKQQISDWLSHLQRHLADDGVLLATYFIGEEDYTGEDWIYPDCSRYLTTTMSSLATENSLNFKVLDWRHPRNQVWAAFYRNDFDVTMLPEEITWNGYIDRLPPA